MLSINDKEFVAKFDINEAVVGIIGFGYVGQALEAFFQSECRTRVYDKYRHDLSLAIDTLNEVVEEAGIIFVCVPTPMNKDGSCHTGIIESVLDDIETASFDVGRDPQEFVVIVKSTVPVGFTDKMNEVRPLRVVFSPEFLTEKNSIDDLENTNRIIVGGDLEDARVVYKYFERKMESRGDVVSCEASEAELVKLFANGLMMTKVLFANEMYQICQKLGANYNIVKTLACYDPRFTSSHLGVPGHDGDIGCGGHCFIKDVNSLKYLANLLGVDEHMFTAALERNDELRTDRDWERMEGRAVVKDYNE